jgi:hypothetical protein
MRYALLISAYTFVIISLYWQYSKIKNDFELYKLKIRITQKNHILEVQETIIDPNIIIYIVGGCIIFGLSVYGINLGSNLVKGSFLD